MSKITIMRGLPASGKSTRCAELLKVGNTVRINKDLLRKMLHLGVFTNRNEGHTQDASRKLADWFLTQGMNVVIDDTNLNPKVQQSWRDLARIHNARIEYIDCDTPVADCIQRDWQRINSGDAVGEHVIKKMALQYKNYLQDEKVVICDLDGTLCNVDHRLHYVEQEPKDWKGFFSEISGDLPRTDVAQMIKECGEDIRIIFVSARPEDYRHTTLTWLYNHLAPLGLQKQFELLIMRERRDTRPDTIVKEEIYEKYLKNLNIVKVFDDRPSVVRMWQSKGLEVVDCGDGIDF